MTFNRIDVYEKNLARVHEWIRSVDQKLSIFLALQGVFLVFITPLAISLVSDRFMKIHPCEFGLLAIAYVLLLAGVGKCLWSLYATLELNNHKKYTEDQLSTTYFQHISDTGTDKYASKMKALTVSQYTIELISQIHVSSKITTKKHKHFNHAIILFSVGSTLLIFTLLLICFTTYNP